MQNFINVIKQNKVDFVHAIEHRLSTTVYNRHPHQIMRDLVNEYDWEGVEKFLKSDSHYLHNVLDGVCLVFTDGDFKTKRKVVLAYDQMVTKINTTKW